MKKIYSLIQKHEDLIANTVFITGLVLMGIIAYAVLSCPRVPCFRVLTPKATQYFPPGILQSVPAFLCPTKKCCR